MRELSLHENYPPPNEPSHVVPLISMLKTRRVSRACLLSRVTFAFARIEDASSTACTWHVPLHRSIERNLRIYLSITYFIGQKIWLLFFLAWSYLRVPSVDDASNDNIARFISHAYAHTHTHTHTFKRDFVFHLLIGKIHFAHVMKRAPMTRIEDAPCSGKSAAVLPFGRNSV